MVNKKLIYWQWWDKYLATSGYCSIELCLLYLHNRGQSGSDKTNGDWRMIVTSK